MEPAEPTGVVSAHHRSHLYQLGKAKVNKKPPRIVIDLRLKTGFVQKTAFSSIIRVRSGFLDMLSFFTFLRKPAIELHSEQNNWALAQNPASAILPDLPCAYAITTYSLYRLGLYKANSIHRCPPRDLGDRCEDRGAKLAFRPQSFLKPLLGQQGKVLGVEYL
jgi:hypothetical protein